MRRPWPWLVASVLPVACSEQSSPPPAAPSAPPAPASASPKTQEAPVADAKTSPAPKAVTTASGLKIEELAAGTGASPEAGRTVIVHYTGWLTDGKKFDSSRDRGEPFSFVLGRRQVIRGWDEGVALMKVGGKCRLTIPPELGYGSRGAGGVIPPNATLVFEVELLDVK